MTVQHTVDTQHLWVDILSTWKIDVWTHSTTPYKLSLKNRINYNGKCKSPFQSTWIFHLMSSFLTLWHTSWKSFMSYFVFSWVGKWWTRLSSPQLPPAPLLHYCSRLLFLALPLSAVVAGFYPNPLPFLFENFWKRNSVFF